MLPFSLASLRQSAQSDRVEACTHVQLLALREKETRDFKPYRELTVGDAEGRMTLRAWNDSPNFEAAGLWQEGDFLAITGLFQVHPAFGLDAVRWEARLLEGEEIEALLGGSPELRAKQEADYEAIVALVESMVDPRLRAIARLFLTEFNDRFRRAAAARTYHHARRGGLVEHTAQMMRTAAAIAGVYPALNRDLLLTGTLFHDIGKLWENCPEPRGFGIPYDERGELIGHITLGVEMLNTLWRKLMASPEAEEWQGVTPPNEEVRTHLIHLIASHHGEMAFGSPVVPKTPEAHALHYIDNLDAKLEMVFSAYRTGTPLTPQITERVRPLAGNLVTPLPAFTPRIL